jgi:hypothetical protein
VTESGNQLAWRFVPPAEIAGPESGTARGRLQALTQRWGRPAADAVPAPEPADPEALTRALAGALQNQGSPSRIAVLDPPGSGAAGALRLLSEHWKLRVLGPEAPPAEVAAREPLVVPRLERMFLRTPAGLERLRTLLEALMERKAPTIVGCGSWAWRFLGAAYELDLGFPHQLVPAPPTSAPAAPTLPAALETDDLFCIQAMLLHDGLDQEALARLVPLPTLELRLRLTRLGELGLTRYGEEGWTVSPGAYQALRRALAQAGFWVDELRWRGAERSRPPAGTAASFHLAPEHDAGLVQARLRDVALASALLAIERPVMVMVEEQPWGTCYRIHAEPAQAGLAARLTSDLTVRGKALLLGLGYRLAASPAGAEAGRAQARD